jgi:tetratricopeptide (TPR) repeat protein
MGDVLMREKPTGLVSAAEAKPIQFTPTDTKTNSESYAQRHYRRAQEYMKKGNWKEAEQELRDAIKIEAGKSEYHALLGVAYLQQNLQSMAKVYLRQALKLNPKDPLACRFAPKLGLEIVAPLKEQLNGSTLKDQVENKAAKNSGLFGFFRSKK